jgi:hypothetical protein
MKKTAIFCLLLMAFAGCRKSGISKISTSLDTLAKTPDTLAINKDTLFVSAMISARNISRFQYDGNKRLVAETDSGTFDYGNDTVKSFFGYDTQGNLIRREISGKYGDTVYNITYVNGQPTSATYLASLAGTAFHIAGTIKYTVTNNKVTEIDGSVYPAKLKLQITYSGDNVASISVNGGSFADPLVNYNYGTKKSPYAASAFKWFLFPDWLPLVEWRSLFHPEYPVNMFNQNDLESLSAPARSDSIKFTNQYNTSGYPTKIVANGVAVTYQYIK